MGTFTARRDRSTTVELGVAQSTQRAQRKKTKRARANANRLVLFSLRSLRALRELLLLTFSRNDKIRDIKLCGLPAVARGGPEKLRALRIEDGQNVLPGSISQTHLLAGLDIHPPDIIIGLDGRVAVVRGGVNDMLAVLVPVRRPVHPVEIVGESALAGAVGVHHIK